MSALCSLASAGCIWRCVSVWFNQASDTESHMWPAITCKWFHLSYWKVILWIHVWHQQSIYDTISDRIDDSNPALWKNRRSVNGQCSRTKGMKMVYPCGWTIGPCWGYHTLCDIHLSAQLRSQLRVVSLFDQYCTMAIIFYCSYEGKRVCNTLTKQVAAFR